jgi:LPS sulfotransferase NodH
VDNLTTRVKQAAKILIHGSTPGINVHREIRAITKDEVEEARVFFKREKFFIFGHARSGTTLLARLIRLHPEVHCNWQAHFFTRAPLLKSLVDDPEVEKWLSQKSNRWNRGKDLSPVVLRATADFILERDAQAAGKRIVGDKSPSSVFHGAAVQNMAAVYPDGRLINIVRDGRDTAISHRFQGFVDRQEKMSSEDRKIRNAFIIDPQPFLTGQRSLFTEKELLETAGSWVKNVTETESEGLRLFGDHYYQFRYEDLMADPWEEMSRIWKFLGAEKPDKKLRETLQAEMSANPDKEWQKEKSGNLAQYIPKGQQGTWQNLFTARDKALFKQVAGELLIKWRYEKDLEW